MIANATSTLNTQMPALQPQEAKMQAYITQVPQQCQTQFTALNAMIVNKQSTASFLQQTFNPTTTSS